jgi:hypothetical protein
MTVSLTFDLSKLAKAFREMPASMQDVLIDALSGRGVFADLLGTARARTTRMGRPPKGGK